MALMTEISLEPAEEVAFMFKFKKDLLLVLTSKLSVLTATIGSALNTEFNWS